LTQQPNLTNQEEHPSQAQQPVISTNNQQNQPSYDDVIEQFSDLSLEDNRSDLSNEEVEVTSQLQVPSCIPNPPRPRRKIQPTKRYLEYIQSQSLSK